MSKFEIISGNPSTGHKELIDELVALDPDHESKVKGLVTGVTFTQKDERYTVRLNSYLFLSEYSDILRMLGGDFTSLVYDDEKGKICHGRSYPLGVIDLMNSLTECEPEAHQESEDDIVVKVFYPEEGQEYTFLITEDLKVFVI